MVFNREATFMAYRRTNAYMNQGAYKAGVKIGSFFLGIAGGV
jgi:hypothetical protein